MVGDTYAYRNGTDPSFYEDSDYISCNICGREYNYREYRSFTCNQCESEGK